MPAAGEAPRGAGRRGRGGPGPVERGLGSGTGIVPLRSRAARGLARDRGGLGSWERRATRPPELERAGGGALRPGGSGARGLPSAGPPRRVSCDLVRLAPLLPFTGRGAAAPLASKSGGAGSRSRGPGHRPATPLRVLPFFLPRTPRPHPAPASGVLPIWVTAAPHSRGPSPPSHTPPSGRGPPSPDFASSIPPARSASPTPPWVLGQKAGREWTEFNGH